MISTQMSFSRSVLDYNEPNKENMKKISSPFIQDCWIHTHLTLFINSHRYCNKYRKSAMSKRVYIDAYTTLNINTTFVILPSLAAPLNNYILHASWWLYMHTQCLRLFIKYLFSKTISKRVKLYTIFNFFLMFYLKGNTLSFNGFTKIFSMDKLNQKNFNISMNKKEQLKL